ncbi:hypothetical protein [Pandoraea vervacti]|uniref:hypothetical protein n=1 Tax=Pandoraea vervacti TaxID=656178 RepID=UPI0012F4E114|nr:hypothetical protein [Pandoraea vervacti]
MFYAVRRSDPGDAFRTSATAHLLVLVPQQLDSRRNEMAECQLTFAKSHPIDVSRAVGQSAPNFVINYAIARILHHFGSHLVPIDSRFCRPRAPLAPRAGF